MGIGKQRGHKISAFATGYIVFHLQKEGERALGEVMVFPWEGPVRLKLCQQSWLNTGTASEILEVVNNSKGRSRYKHTRQSLETKYAKLGYKKLE
jgi:hypothetical protein